MGRTNGPFLGKTNGFLRKQMEGMTVYDDVHFCRLSLDESGWSFFLGVRLHQRGDL